MKANRETFVGVIRVFINKFRIPDGEWFDLEDVEKFRKEEEKIYLQETRLESIDDYRKIDKYIINKYEKSPAATKQQD